MATDSLPEMFKLDGSNYQTWKVRMKLLMKEGTWPYVSSQRRNRGSEETQTDGESRKNGATGDSVSEAGADVTSTGLQCQALVRSPNWWPFGVRSAVAAVESEPCSAVANTTKWNFRMGQNAGAGALAGGVVSLCLHPVDTLKTIVQAQTGGSRNLLPILSSIILERGLKGLYRDLGSNLTASAPISAIYTLTYEPSGRKPTSRRRTPAVVAERVKGLHSQLRKQCLSPLEQ